MWDCIIFILFMCRLAWYLLLVRAIKVNCIVFVMAYNNIVCKDFSCCMEISCVVRVLVVGQILLWFLYYTWYICFVSWTYFVCYTCVCCWISWLHNRCVAKISRRQSLVYKRILEHAKWKYVSIASYRLLLFCWWWRWLVLLPHSHCLVVNVHLRFLVAL